jgi:hypothetical protein
MLILIPGANCDWPATIVGSFGIRIQTRCSIGSGGEFRPAHAWIGLIVTLHAIKAQLFWKGAVRPVGGITIEAK